MHDSLCVAGQIDVHVSVFSPKVQKPPFVHVLFESSIGCMIGHYTLVWQKQVTNVAVAIECPFWLFCVKDCEALIK